MADTDGSLLDVNDTGTTYWNERLLYHFEGGVGVGHFQGRVSAERARLAAALAQGYAVAYSSGNRTGEHYNLQLGGETALMVKEHFIKRFGEPDYTVAIGGSGGAIQQYVYQQNHPGLIDAGVPQYSYPDMVTQTIHVGDCELLEHYMDVTDRDNPRWQETKARSLLLGFNSTDAVPDPLAEAKQSLGYSSAPGSNECIPAWRGLTPLSMNPHYGQVREQDKMHPPGIMADVKWTHYDDLRNIYGVDARGWARVPWDNVGVQYGLQALREGAIDAASFTAVRLLSGALMLALILLLRDRQVKAMVTQGNHGSALALFVYAAGFSLAYVALATGTGALLLFGAVQATMVGVGLYLSLIHI